MKTTKEILNDKSSKDYVLSFMFGVEDSLEREILRYVHQSHNSVTYCQLVNKFVWKEQMCSEKRLGTRLLSLVKFNFLIKSEYKNAVFYEVVFEDVAENKTENL